MQSTVHQTEDLLFSILLQLTVMILAARLPRMGHAVPKGTEA